MKNKFSIVVVVVGYKRPEAFSRAMRSALVAASMDENTFIYAVVDGGGDEEVIKVANSFMGEKNVTLVKHENNKGLKNNILWCGDLVELYDAVVIVEDDIFIDKFAIDYLRRSAELCYGSDIVAGVALYSPKFNEYNNVPFEPINNGAENYLMQVPCSWGQMWTREQWLNFKNWLAEDHEIDNLMPEPVKKWSKKSWKKLFYNYLIKEKKYFLYPYKSYSTNFADVGGQHISKGSSAYQVPMATQQRKFHCVAESCYSINELVRYDAYLELMLDGINLGDPIFKLINKCDVEMDIQGVKPLALLTKKKYVITSKKTRKKIKKWSSGVKPLEMVVVEGDIFSGSGVDIYLTNSKDLMKESKIDKIIRGINLKQEKSYFQVTSIYVLIALVIFHTSAKINDLIARLRT